MTSYNHLKDYEVFLSELPDLMKEYENKVVVYHDGERDSAVYDRFLDALYAGTQTHGEGRFSAQPVEPQVPRRMSHSL